MKNAQIKMFEAIAVLIVFFFLLVIGAVFYFNTQKSLIGREFEKQTQVESLQVVQKALFLPELDCSFVTVQRDNCFDILKLMKFSELIKSEEVLSKYFESFGASKVVITQVYPASELSLTLYSYEPQSYTTKLVTQSPVLLYDAVSQSYAFGIIEVEVYA